MCISWSVYWWTVYGSFIANACADVLTALCNTTGDSAHVRKTLTEPGEAFDGASRCS